MQILNFNIPIRMSNMIDQGIWVNYKKFEKLDKYFSLLDLKFYSVEGIKGETKYCQELYANKEMRIIYGLASSIIEQLDIKDSLLDIDKCLIIGGNLSEDIIVLDYRYNVENPRVLISQGDNEAYYLEIAKDFNSLLDYLEN